MIGRCRQNGNMGYYTSYALTCKGPDKDVQAFEQDLINISKSNGEVDPDVRELVSLGTVYAKLYDIEDWIDELAPKHPNVLICLAFDGEDSEDTGETRWKNKDKETQKMVIPPFTNPNLQ